jgi:hypothetical protein
VVEHHRRRQTLDGAGGGPGGALGLVDLVAGVELAPARAVCAGLGALQRRGRAGGRCGGRCGGLVALRAGHAGRRCGTALVALQRLLVAHRRRRCALVGLEFLGHGHRLAEVDVSRHGGTQVFAADHGLDELHEPALQAVFHLVHVLQLLRIEPRGAFGLGRGEQGAAAVGHCHCARVQVGYARRHQVHDARELGAIEGAAGPHVHDDGRRGLLLLAEESVLRRQRQHHLGRLHHREAADGAHQLALERALDRHVLAGLRLAEALLVQQLVALHRTLGQAGGAELHAHLVHAVGRHHDGAAAFAELVRHVHRRQLRQDGPAVAVADAGIKHAKVGLARVHHEGDADGRQCGHTRPEGQQGPQRDARKSFRERRALGHQGGGGGGDDGVVHAGAVREACWGGQALLNGTDCS